MVHFDGSDRNLAGPVGQHPDFDTLGTYLDGALPAPDRAVVAAHITACVDCRRELAELRATVSLLHDLPQYEPRRAFRVTPGTARRPVVAPGGRIARLLPGLPT